MVNTLLLKSKMTLNEDTLETLAEYLHISRQTLYFKITNRTDFTQSEIKAIIIRYALTAEETNEIFFGDVDECE